MIKSNGNYVFIAVKLDFSFYVQSLLGPMVEHFFGKSDRKRSKIVRTKVAFCFVFYSFMGGCEMDTS
jgi:hypothetical protein